MRTRHSYYYIFTYTPINHLNYGIYLQWRDPLLLIQYNNTVWHLYAAKPYFVDKRPEPLKSSYLLPLYTLIHLLCFNILAAQVLGLGIP